MKWKHIDTGLNTVSFNMNLDLQIAKSLPEDTAVLRTYRWQPFCISLGANQKNDSIDSYSANKNNIDIVIRPTGGRAILHSEELTYSVILPINFNSSAKNIYHEINIALKKGLTFFNPKLEAIQLESVQADFQSLYKETKGIICFAVPAKSELKYNGRKVVGSAQRKLDKTILQHGSILCGKYHLNIVNYMKISDIEKIKLKNEIESSTTTLDQILNQNVDYEILSESILKGFEKYFNCKFDKQAQFEFTPQLQAEQ